jgi:energy-coupling factor transport system permease protein
MLVTWRYRKHDNSVIQNLDPRAWWIFYFCFIATTLLFWDLRYLIFLMAIALFFVFTSGIRWREMARAWIFIGGFVVFFAFLTFLTGRGGMEVYQVEHFIARFQAPFTILGWRPTLEITLERTFFALSQMVRVFSLASMTILIPYALNPAH